MAKMGPGSVDKNSRPVNRDGCLAAIIRSLSGSLGIDVDTKVTGLKGEGTLAVKKVYTRFDDVRSEIVKGRDPRGSIIAKLKDPDAVGKQTERYQIGNVALGEFAKTWEMGAVVKEEYPFTFTPTDMIMLDQIKDV